MDIKLHLEQKQVLSQRMIQSAQILQMSAQELGEYIEAVALENPVIDMEERKPEAAQGEEDRLRKYEWLNSLDNQNSYSYFQRDPDDDRPEGDYNFSVNEGETLKDYLWAQLITADFTKKELKVLDYMLESLDSRGYMTEHLDSVAKRFGVEQELVESLLGVLQGLDPAGVCARSLSECLILQAKRFGALTPVLRAIITEHLEQLAKNQLPAIAKQLKVPLDEVSRYCEWIKNLNPKPGSSFCSRERLSYIVPDVTVVKFKDHFEILLNEYLYPDIQVNSYYSRLSKEQLDAETTSYLQDKIRQAEWVRDCVSKRNSTLMDVTKAILESQEGFFQNSGAGIRPLRLLDVAEKLGVHESTVSRAVRGKYLQCSWGIYPMNYFFSKAVSTGNSDTGSESKDLSTAQIKQAMEEIIKNENKKKPLSDRAISEELAGRGIAISRRTVAKYRAELAIPDAGGRKQYGDRTNPGV